ncbi:MAG: phage tail protein [Candidatus Nanopelagicales bacterium]
MGMEENLELLVPALPPQDVSWKKATVTGVSPVRIQFDGDTAPMTTTPDKLCSVAVGDRVHVQLLGKQVIINGVFTSADTQPGDVPTGTVLEFAGTVAPAGYLLFYGGEAVSRAGYPKLFGVLGTTWGAGDGSTTFNLPNKAGRVAVSRDPADTAIDTYGKLAGAWTATLTKANLAAHGHTFEGTGTVRAMYWAGAVYAGGGGGAFSGDSHASADVAVSVSGTTDDSGSGTAFSIRGKSIVMPFIIKL